MNSSELLKVAGRAVEWYTTPNTPDACRNMPDHVFYAGYHACRAIIAEHPPDDDEPWDFPWIRSIYNAVPCGDFLLLQIPGGPLMLRAWNNVRWDLTSDYNMVHDIPRPETRRDVRQLLRALGFKTRETT